jgi:arylformamidase
MCLQTSWEEDYGLPQDPFKCALLFSGLYDIAPLRYSYLQPAIQLDDGVVQRNSPAFMARPCSTPTWITWGGNETAEFARQAHTFDAAWRAQGNQADPRVGEPGQRSVAVVGATVSHWIVLKTLLKA